jgi:hypothetical protein
MTLSIECCPGAVRIDNVPFRLHYSFTSGFLFLGTAHTGIEKDILF